MNENVNINKSGMKMINNTNEHFVSVVIPVKQGRYLEHAVSSLLVQDHRKMEIIIIDDNCSDADLVLIANMDSRIKVVTNPGRGLVDALNAGLNLAKGDCIARMDADDLCVPNRISTQLRLLDEFSTPVIIAARVEIFKTQGEVDLGYKLYQEWLNGLVTPAEIARDFFIESPLPHPTVLIPREVIDLVGLYRDGPWPEDYDYWLRAKSLGVSFAKPEAILLRWRDDSDRTSRNDARYARERFMFLKADYVEPLITNRKVYIWGSGETGLQLYDALNVKGIEVSGFIDVHPRRIGKMKRNVPVYDLVTFLELDGVTLCAVSVWGVREKIRKYMDENGKTETIDYWFFA